jgi:hypothetical protein
LEAVEAVELVALAELVQLALAAMEVLGLLIVLRDLLFITRTAVAGRGIKQLRAMGERDLLAQQVKEALERLH